MFGISNYIHIKKGCIYQNGQMLFRAETSDFLRFSKEAYLHLDLQYPKFHKMDNLCKLAILASEIALLGHAGEETALLFCNRESSLDTDIMHQQKIQDKDNYYPSPSTFVYTLPNISIGELSIRHQLKTESIFLLADHFQTAYIRNYTSYLLANKKAENVLCGWLQMLGDDYEAIFYLVEQNGKLEHNNKNIEHIIHKNYTMAGLKEELKQQIIDVLNLEDITAEDIQDDVALFGDGLGLDSIDALELIVLLDKEYGIKLADPKQGREIFQSIDILAKYIEQNRTK